MYQRGKGLPRILGSGEDGEDAGTAFLGFDVDAAAELLHPPLLDETGLSSALHWYVQGLEERSTLSITLEISPEFRRLPNDLELAIFRFVQEGLTNVHRHSGSATANIHLGMDAETIQVSVASHGLEARPITSLDLPLHTRSRPHNFPTAAG